jgi:hypothetical protein
MIGMKTMVQVKPCHVQEKVEREVSERTKENKGEMSKEKPRSTGKVEKNAVVVARKEKGIKERSLIRPSRLKASKHICFSSAGLMY